MAGDAGRTPRTCPTQRHLVGSTGFPLTQRQRSPAGGGDRQPGRTTLGRRGDELRRDPRGQGSGVILTSDGYIATNDHVVAGFSSYTVRLSTGALLPAQVVGQDPQDDLAVLKVAATTLTPIRFAASSSARVRRASPPDSIDRAMKGMRCCSKLRSSRLGTHRMAQRRQQRTPGAHYWRILPRAGRIPREAGGPLAATNTHEPAGWPPTLIKQMTGAVVGNCDSSSPAPAAAWQQTVVRGNCDSIVTRVNPHVTAV